MADHLAFCLFHETGSITGRFRRKGNPPSTDFAFCQHDYRSGTGRDSTEGTKDLTRIELEHAIRAACDVSGDTEVYVLGSQAILGQYPEAPEELRQSAEADIAPKNHPEAADSVDAALGELSRFHETHGFYVHGLTMDAATLPEGWEKRVYIVVNANTRENRGICLGAHDLAASKLVAFRDKDRRFVETLISEKMIEGAFLLQLIRQLDIAEELRVRIVNWVERTIKDI